MNKDELIDKIKEIQKLKPSINNSDLFHSYYILTLQFISNYIGKESEFYDAVKNYKKVYASESSNKLLAADSALISLKNYLNLEFREVHSYKIKINIISDYITQSIFLINDKKYHPAAAAILLGASLEEFLKHLAITKSVEISDIKQTIYPKYLSIISLH